MANFIIGLVYFCNTCIFVHFSYLDSQSMRPVAFAHFCQLTLGKLYKTRTPKLANFKSHFDSSHPILKHLT